MVGWLISFSDCALYNLTVKRNLWMSRGQLVFLFIGLMSSESWYVRVALSRNHSARTKSKVPLGTMEERLLCFEETSKTKEWETAFYMYNVFYVSCRGRIQKHLSGDKNKSWELSYLVLVWGKLWKPSFQVKRWPSLLLSWDHTGVKDKLRNFTSARVIIVLYLTFLARCLKSSVLLMRPDLQSGFR